MYIFCHRFSPMPSAIKIEPRLSLEELEQGYRNLWPLVNEAIANRTFTDLDELEETVINRCQKIMEQKEIVRGITNFYWWPN